MKFERMTRLSVPEEIIESIKEKIVSGELQSGDQLPPETKMAEMFGVGRGTMREAIKGMLYLGLIERNSSRIAVIAHSAREKAILRSFLDRFEGHRDAMEIVEMRKIVEPEAAAIAAERREDYVIEKLEEELAAMGSNDDIETFINADKNYHHLIFSSTGNSLIGEFMERINEVLRREQGRMLRGSRTIKPKSMVFHRQIIDAIRDGDSKRARSVMLQHILDIEEEMYMMYKKQG